MEQGLLNSPTDGHVVSGNTPNANRNMPNPPQRMNTVMGPVIQSLCGPDGVNSAPLQQMPVEKPRKCGCQNNDTTNRNGQPPAIRQPQPTGLLNGYVNSSQPQPVRPPVSYANANRNYPGIAPPIKNQ